MLRNRSNEKMDLMGHIIHRIYLTIIFTFNAFKQVHVRFNALYFSQIIKLITINGNST